MTEKFESQFHKRYVGGEGEVEEKPIILISPNRSVIRPTTLEEVEDEYRRYVGDMTAELPEEVRRAFLALKKIESDGAE